MGKSSSSNYLKKNYGYEGVVLARTLKRMVEVFLIDLGYPLSKVHRMVHEDLKEQVIPEIGKTTRDLMVSLGTKWGRNEVHPNIWVNIATTNLTKGILHISDDIRYQNEYTAFREAGFKIVRINNPRVALVESVSEGNLEDCVFDYKIENDGTLDDLYSKLEDMLSYFGR